MGDKIVLLAVLLHYFGLKRSTEPGRCNIDVARSIDRMSSKQILQARMQMGVTTESNRLHMDQCRHNRLDSHPRPSFICQALWKAAAQISFYFITSVIIRVHLNRKAFLIMDLFFKFLLRRSVFFVTYLKGIVTYLLHVNQLKIYLTLL